MNGDLIIEDWTDHAPREQSASVELAGEQVIAIQLEYYERGGGGVIRLEWETPDQPRALLQEVLPPPNLPDRFFRFEDAGIDIGNGKAAWGDFDNDGRVDLLAASSVYRNTGEGFDEFARVGAGIWGDFDNDGWLDVFNFEERRLFRNDWGERFVNITAEAIPELPAAVTVGAAWADFDGDAFLDLYLGGFENPSYNPDVILLNQGGKSFRVAWVQEGDVDPARGITACDFDEDGDVDVYVSNYRLEQNQLWRNNGRARFTNVGPGYGVAGTDDGWSFSYGHTIGSAWGDLDADGHFDLFVGNFSHPDAWQDRPGFYRNLGPQEDYRFEDRSDDADLAWQESFASPALGDVDNDGDLDLYFTTVYSGDRNVLYLNRGGFRFTERTDTGLPVEGVTYQAAWADYDGDGDLDLATNGRLYQNSGNDNDWIAIHLVGDGVNVNAAAIGAQVRAAVGTETITRQVESGTGEGNQNDLTLHFGLGVVEVDTVAIEIRWPDGVAESMEVPVNARTFIVYGRVRFVRGELNDDGELDTSDVIFLLRWLFLRGPRPGCVAAADVTGDAAVDIGDPLHLLFYLFAGAQPPVAPFPLCGSSAREPDGALGCEFPPRRCR